MKTVLEQNVIDSLIHRDYRAGIYETLNETKGVCWTQRRPAYDTQYHGSSGRPISHDQI